ncbi:MAG: hypothetical protein D6721_07390 [Gammaproteobacteria bacterium]|nr:MAG: hypothetical protein D6721_07390 [Gammaproteobacteria bacterium]
MKPGTRGQLDPQQPHRQAHEQVADHPPVPGTDRPGQAHVLVGPAHVLDFRRRGLGCGLGLVQLVQGGVADRR